MFLFVACGLVVFVLGLQTFVLAPFAVYYEFWKKRFLRQSDRSHRSVSVIVPAYNEEDTIHDSIGFILSSDYPDFEVIVVNDGSRDGTVEQLAPFVESGRITCISQPNGGKASALNAGIRVARGDIIVFTDADSFFLPDTIGNLARWFADPSIQAVSGNDEPINPSTTVQKLLVITTHIGSGFVRRALSVMRVLPIISGNLGAVRRGYVGKVNGFSDLWGEDLDLTFKLHKAGARIIFDPEARVMCDVPATIPSLWRQRVRWMRSFLKICVLHRDLFFSTKYAPFSYYLPLNWLNMVVVPLTQIVALALLPVALESGMYRFGGVLDVVAYSGMAIFFAVSLFGILLDKSFRHLRYLPLYGWLIIPFSYMYTAVLTYSIYREITGTAEDWQRSDRHVLSMTSSSPHRFTAYAAWPWAVVCVAVLVLISSLPASRGDGREPPLVASSAGTTIAVATHFDAWSDPEDAINSVVNRREAGAVSLVGIEAGRVEWNFFKWEGHESTWSNDQRASGRDLLENAVEVLRDKGKKAVAILDFYAPLYLRENPTVAAIDADGNPSSEQVCFMELTDGRYGKEIIAMATYLASHYDLEGISVTELEYNRYCYDDRCLRSFAGSTVSRTWPHRFLSTAIDRENHDLGEWRSRRMAGFLEIIADSVHAYGKKLYVDVPVHEKALTSEGVHSGLSYPMLLKFTDALIVWDYFYLDGRSPSSSVDIAKFFTSRYDPERIIISIGLWGDSRPVSADELSEAVRYSILGGARHLWITPNHLMTDEHWRSLELALKNPQHGITTF